MFYLFYYETCETSLNKSKPLHLAESRRNHVNLARVVQETLKTLVFIAILRGWTKWR